MKSLVTGGAGFIGCHLVKRLLEKGHEVVVLDNFKRGNKLDKESMVMATVVEGDVCDADTVHESMRGCDYVFHLAAVLGVDIVADNPVETMETETLGMRNVCRSAIVHGNTRLVYSSTSGVYGKRAIEQAVDEDFNASPNSSYSIAKRYNEIFLKAMLQEKGLESAAIRYFNVYGPRQDQRMVISRFFAQALLGEPITVYGTGRQTRDFTYIDDVVDATLRVAECFKGCEVYNISHGHECTIADLAQRIKAVTGSSSEVLLVDTPTGRYDFEVERRLGNSAKLRALIGDSPVTPLAEGLGRTYRWIRGE